MNKNQWKNIMMIKCSIPDMESTIGRQISIDIKWKLDPIEQWPKPLLFAVYTGLRYQVLQRFSQAIIRIPINQPAIIMECHVRVLLPLLNWLPSFTSFHKRWRRSLWPMSQAMEAVCWNHVWCCTFIGMRPALPKSQPDCAIPALRF